MGSLPRTSSDALDLFLFVPNYSSTLPAGAANRPDNSLHNNISLQLTCSPYLPILTQLGTVSFPKQAVLPVQIQQSSVKMALKEGALNSTWGTELCLSSSPSQTSEPAQPQLC